MRTLLWIARVGSLVVLALHLIPLLNQPPDWGALTTPEKIDLAVWGIILLGMIMAWTREGFGSIAIIGGFLVQVALDPRVLTMWEMWVAPIVGMLFLIHWVMS